MAIFKHICVVIPLLVLSWKNVFAASCTAPSDCLGNGGYCHLTNHHWTCLDNHCLCKLGARPIISSDMKYTLMLQRDTYKEAASSCKSLGQQLVQIDSDAELQRVRNFVYPIIRSNFRDDTVYDKYDGILIGLRHYSRQHSDVYQYTDGTDAQFFHWDRNEPNHRFHDNCVMLSFDHFLMRVTDCNDSLFYVCEKTVPNLVIPGSTLPPSKGQENCIQRSDCQSQCRTAEYHCVEYNCICGFVGPN